MAPLDRKLARDLWRMKGQVVAIALVIAAGVATVVLALGTLHSLQETRDAYYDRYQFANVFAQARRAPEHLARQVAAIPGVAQVECRYISSLWWRRFGGLRLWRPWRRRYQFAARIDF